MSRAELMRTVGASGRRMPRHLLPALSVLLLLLGCACGPTHAGDDAPVSSVPLFVGGKTKVPAKVGDEGLTEDVISFHSSFLAAGNSVMLAFAEAWYTGGSDNTVDIVVKRIETEGSNWAKKTIENNGSNWKTQLAMQKKNGTYHSALTSLGAVVKDNKIYLLALRSRPKKDLYWDTGLDFGVVVGKIMGGLGNKTIEWGESDSLRSKLTEKVEGLKLVIDKLDSASAFLTSKGRLVFTMGAKNEEGKSGFAIMQLKDDEEQWKVSFVERPEECHFVSVFEWKEKLISIVSDFSHNRRYVKEHDETEEGWKDAEAMPLYLSDERQRLGDFTSVTIANTNLVLFSQKYSGDESPRSPDYYRLWVTDGSRVLDAGVIVGGDYVGFGRLFYTNDELFSMYLLFVDRSAPLVLTRLKQQLKTIKSVLRTWARNDAYLSKPCSETAPEGASPDTPCVTPMPTDGLVGFLSNKGDATHWKDKYRFTNATLRNETRLKNGFRFNGARSGAQWPVGQRYMSYKNNIARYGLTAVATVIIHEIPKNDTPLLTVDGFEDSEINERLGLWYKDKQWKVVSNDGKEESAIDLKTNTSYKVTLILHNNTISVYVNGKSRRSPLPISTFDEEPFDIKNVYIAGYDHGSGINMTVTNVFLYNRVLSDTELRATSRTVATAMLTDFEDTLATPKDPKFPKFPKEDSSGHVRMGVSLLFLLVLQALALFS